MAHSEPFAKSAPSLPSLVGLPLRKVFTFLSGWKKSREERHFVTHENCMKFKFPCPYIDKVYRHQWRPFVHIPCVAAFVLTVAAFIIGTETVWPAERKISTLCPFREQVLWTPGFENPIFSFHQGSPKAGRTSVSQDSPSSECSILLAP